MPFLSREQRRLLADERDRARRSLIINMQDAARKLERAQSDFAVATEALLACEVEKDAGKLVRARADAKRAVHNAKAALLKARATFTAAQPNEQLPPMDNRDAGTGLAMMGFLSH
jgi:hypothetical protein